MSPQRKPPLRQRIRIGADHPAPRPAGHLPGAGRGVGARLHAWRRPRRLGHLVLALGLVAAVPARAVELPRDPGSTLSFTIENDLFGGTDRYYTSGFQFSWRSASYDPPAWLEWVADVATPFLPEGGALRWGLAFGQNIFTPDDTLRRNPDPEDRPYAGWLYGAFVLTSYTPTTYGSFELQAGVVGPAALGRQVQNNVHDFLGVDRAYGWDYQLKDEFGINAVFTRQWRLNHPFDPSDPRGLAVGLVPNVTVSLGNVQTYASAGVTLRYGSNLLADFGPPRVRPSLAGSAFFQPDGRWGWYVFAGVEGRAVARDIFLDGNTWRDSRSVDKEPLVGDASLGFTLVMPWARLSYTHKFRTREFEGGDWVQFGSISLSVRF
jgi:hypothetical protein